MVWVMPVRQPNRGLPAAESLPPHLKEFTITVGQSDLYVNLDRHVEGEDGHTLYEAILSDAEGSRRIFVDREDLALCLANSPILQPEEEKDGKGSGVPD